MEETNLKGTVLLMDDTPASIDVVKAALEKDEYKVLVATNGERAIKRLTLTSPDLILLDIRMPGIDGDETCRRLKADEATSAIPVIFMSGLKEPFDEVKGFAAGAVGYMTRPFQPEEVLAGSKPICGCGRCPNVWSNMPPEYRTPKGSDSPG